MSHLSTSEPHQPAISTTSEASKAAEFCGIPQPARRALVKARSTLAKHGVDLLRISLGVVFLTFGALKFFPGASPAEELAVRTLDTLTLGVVSGGSALLLTAIMETVIGLTLLTGKFVKIGLLILSAALVGIMSPLVLFFEDLFPGGLPTIAAQYVFKDIVLAAAGLVVAAQALGARFISRDGVN